MFFCFIVSTSSPLDLIGGFVTGGVVFYGCTKHFDFGNSYNVCLGVIVNLEVASSYFVERAKVCFKGSILNTTGGREVNSISKAGNFCKVYTVVRVGNCKGAIRNTLEAGAVCRSIAKNNVAYCLSLAKVDGNLSLAACALITDKVLGVSREAAGKTWDTKT